MTVSHLCVFTEVGKGFAGLCKEAGMLSFVMGYDGDCKYHNHKRKLAHSTLLGFLLYNNKTIINTNLTIIVEVVYSNPFGNFSDVSWRRKVQMQMFLVCVRMTGYTLEKVSKKCFILHNARLILYDKLQT